MRNISKILATGLLGTAAIMLTACGGHGPNSYLMPKDAVMAKLTGASKEYQIIGNMDRKVSAISWSGDKLNVNVSGEGSKVHRCKAIVEAIDEEWTRVTPECPEGKNAFEQTESEIARMQVDEFVIAVLYNKAVDASMVNKRISAIAIDNMDDMQKEVGQEMAAASESYDSGWDSDLSGGDWGN